MRSCLLHPLHIVEFPAGIVKPSEAEIVKTGFVVDTA
jgi:hypothetical protein